MRISRKIGLSFFITFLLVIILGFVSIYSLRSVYKGLEHVFSKDLPASRLTYQVSISLEDALSELNNFLLTNNENFRIQYKNAYKNMQEGTSRLRKFIFSDEEKEMFEKISIASEDIDRIAELIFKDITGLKKTVKDIRSLETKCNKALGEMLDFEEQKMLSEKDLLLLQAQYMPRSRLISEAKLKLSETIEKLMSYIIKGAEKPDEFIDELSFLDKNIREYKNYYSYSLSEKERGLASDIIDMYSKIEPLMTSIVNLKKEIAGQTQLVFVKEKEAMELFDILISLKKSGISSKLGIGATLTEDMPAIDTISQLEKDARKSWRLSGRYIVTDDKVYKELYSQLRKDIDKELKDYERHARLRGRERYIEEIEAIDNDITGNIRSGLEIFEKREKGIEELLSLKSDIDKNINTLITHNDSLIKESQAGPNVFDKFIPGRWALLRLESELNDAFKLVITYLNEQESGLKDAYSSLYFNMKRHINAYTNLIISEKDINVAKDIESGLDRFNTAVAGVIENHDKIVKERGWTLVKLQDQMKENLDKAIENEIMQLEKNKNELKNKISIINTIVLIIIIVVAFIALFIIFYTTHSITNPIQELYNGAELIGGGNLDHRLNIKTGDEIQDLADGFNRMAGELKESYTNLENKVKERTLQLAEVNEALARTNKELDDFTYIVSHDLKEPLRGIKAFTKMITEDYAARLDDEARAYLKTISESSSRMTRLIEDLLNLSRIGRVKNVERDIDLNQVLSDVKKNLAYAIEEKKVNLKIMENLPKVTCDRIRISEVFSNLISNAIKYTKKGTTPVIEAGYVDKGNVYEFYIKDNGIGIEKQYYDKIFQIFQRLHAKDEYEGTGAGLTIVKKIIESHGGKIWVVSDIGVGSTFYFTLPK